LIKVAFVQIIKEGMRFREFHTIEPAPHKNRASGLISSAMQAFPGPAPLDPYRVMAVNQPDSVICPRINEINRGISFAVISGSRIPLSNRSRGNPVFLPGCDTFFIGPKIIVERDFHKVGVEKDQIILFCIIRDITGSGAPILFLIKPVIIAGQKTG
jgi:hypothetical protein